MPIMGPIYGCLLLSLLGSAATFLWASLPLLAIGILEKIVSRPYHFSEMRGRLLAGRRLISRETSRWQLHAFDGNPRCWKEFSSPGLWISCTSLSAFLSRSGRRRRSQDQSP